MSDRVLILVIEWGAALWVALWLAELAYKEWFSPKVKRNAYWLDREPLECPACGEIALVGVGIVRPRKGHAFVEYECEECKHYETH
jgi:hypothetical protein